MRPEGLVCLGDRAQLVEGKGLTSEGHPDTRVLRVKSSSLSIIGVKRPFCFSTQWSEEGLLFVPRLIPAQVSPVARV